jgi:multiple sugar transport system substrate-binding protein/sn-glycerol 3-phosphate transport system substrate-binding protein
MNTSFKRFVAGTVTVTVIATAAIFSKTPSSVNADATMAATMSGTGSYVKTFDLPTKPTTAGDFAGVDPTGANVVWWEPHTTARAQAVKDAVDKFNANNPWKITVQAVYKGQYSDIYNAMLAALQTKDVPSMSVGYSNQIAQYQNVNAILDLNPLVSDPVYGFDKASLSDFVYLDSDVYPSFNNQRLSISLYRSTELMYYNADALKALGYDHAPKTWDEFKEMSCKFAKSGSGLTGFEVRTDASAIAASAYSQGGDIYDYAKNKFVYDSPEAQVYPTVMQDMLSQGCASLVAAAFGDQNDFAAGKALFYQGSSSGIPFIIAAQKSAKTTFAWDVAAIPYKTAPVQNIYGAPVSILKTTKQQELAAWLFIRWYTEPEQQAAWATTTFYFPMRKSTAANLGDFFAKNPYYQHAFALLSNQTKAEPPVAGYDAIRTLASKALNEVLGTNGNDGKPVVDTFNALNDSANKVLAANPVGAALPTPLPPTATPVPTAAATAAK